jgi:hypothetical protein
MADLSIAIVQELSRMQIMPPPPALNVQLIVIMRLADTAPARAITQLGLPDDEVLHSRANTVSAINDNPAAGEVAFNASPDHAIVTNYIANIRVRQQYRHRDAESRQADAGRQRREHRRPDGDVRRPRRQHVHRLNSHDSAWRKC